MTRQPRRFIVTGAPGSGKTTIVDALKARGFPVVAEAATDVIAWQQANGHDEPWTEPHFLDLITELQRERQLAVPTSTSVHIFDRSPICTLALAHYLNRPVPRALAAEVDRIVREGVYDRRVLFVRPIGFVTPTAARRISFEDSLAFGAVHEHAYRAHGFELIDVPPGTVDARATMVEEFVRSWTAPATPGQP